MWRRLRQARPRSRSTIPLITLLALATILALRLGDPQALNLVRMAIFDGYQRLSPRPSVPAPVRVVDIDNESLERIGQWPWPRVILARMVGKLEAAGAAVIAFDMLFPEPDRTSPGMIVRTWPQSSEFDVLKSALLELPDHDRTLAAAMSRAPVVLGMAPGPGEVPATLPPRKFGFAFTGADPAEYLPHHPSVTGNLPMLQQAASGLGVLTVPVDTDGVVRRMALLVGVNGTVYPSLAVEALRVGQGARSIVARGADAHAETGSGVGALDGLKVGHLTVPTDARGEMWLHYSEGAPGRSIPAWRVLQDDADLFGQVAGNVVLIGTTASGLGDLASTPLNPVEPGVMIHAQALEQILHGQFLERPDWVEGAEIAVLLVIGTALIVVLALWSGVIVNVLSGTAVAGAGIGASWFAYERAGLLLDPLYPALAAVVICVVSVTLRYVWAERERRTVRAAFRRYVAPEVVDQLAERPETLRLGGEMRELTVMFCDIRGFTGIAEALTAEELTRFVNRCLTPMTDAILEAGGTIDKYMGDAVMAFWNAPLSNELHRIMACRAALDLHRRVAESSLTGKSVDGADSGATTQTVRLGVGLSSGPCCVGNFGSNHRFDYSALGDTVNLASRLEQQCKLYGVSTIMAESTWQQAGELASLELDLIQVVGKTQAIRIFALLGDERQATEPWFMELKSCHDDALAAYRRRDWTAAERLFAACWKKADGNLDRLYGMYMTRLAGFREQPPDEDWDAVYRPDRK